LEDGLPSGSELHRIAGVARRRIVRAAAIAGGAALLLAFPAMAPDPYMLSVAIGILHYAVLATSWNFVGGFTGYISLGHGALAGLGSYATGLLVTAAGLPSFAALVAGAVIVALLAVPIGAAALRVRGASFVIVTIALVLILLLVFQSWSFPGGSRGLVVPRPFPELHRAEHHLVFFFLFAGLLALALAAWWAVDRSRFGLGLKAIREDEDKSESLGIPTFAFKLVAFVVSAAFTALGGGLYALWFGDLDPVFQFSVLTGSYIVLMALLGGARHLFGPLLGALAVGSGLEYFKLTYGDTPLHLVATGVLLGVVVMLMPDGVIPAVAELFARFTSPREASIREVGAAELRAADERDERVAGGRPVASLALATVDLTRSFGGVTAVDSATVTIQPGKVNALIGPNGSGKTTLFNCITGMIRPDSGRVTYGRRDITGKPPHQVAGAGIGRTFQLCRVFPRMTALDNLLVATRAGGLRAALASSRDRAAIERARTWLRRVGIDHLERVEARNLSWGQQKLLELAGVMMADPDTILLDEPTGGVNPALIERIGALVRELTRQGKTFVIVEHNMDLVMSLSDHIIVFDRGRPIAEGPPSAIRSDRRVLEAYLGI
jgi:branched-chain amino acid transport system permease protein